MSDTLVPTLETDYRSSLALSPMQTMAEAIHARQQLAEFISRVMVEGEDYGKIPGTERKSLHQPGAQKLQKFFGLRHRFETIEAIKDWSGSDHGGEPFFYFEVRCTILAPTGEPLGDGIGNCCSWESKYRYRSAERVCPQCGKPAIIRGKAEYGGGWLCFKKKDGCGANFAIDDPAITEQAVGRVANPEIFDQIQTFEAMAQKRAHILAVRYVTAASQFFTQDMAEDTQGDDNSASAAPVQPTPPTKPQPAAQLTPQQRKQAAWQAFCDKCLDHEFVGQSTGDYQNLAALLNQGQPANGKWTAEVYERIAALTAADWRKAVQLWNEATSGQESGAARVAAEVATQPAPKPEATVAPTAAPETTQTDEQAQKVAQAKATISPAQQEASANFKRLAMSLGMSYIALKTEQRRAWLAGLIGCKREEVDFLNMGVEVWNKAGDALRAYVRAADGVEEATSTEFIIDLCKQVLHFAPESLFVLERKHWAKLTAHLQKEDAAEQSAEPKAPEPRKRFFAMCKEAGVFGDPSFGPQQMRDWMTGILSKAPANVHLDKVVSRESLNDAQWRYLCDALEFEADNLLATAAEPEHDPELAGAAA